MRPGYKVEDIGEIPEDWTSRAIGASFDFKNGLNKSKRFFGRGTPIINYMDVYHASILKCSDVEGKVTVDRDELRANSAKKGDVFFTRTSETQDEIGSSAVLIDEIEDAVFSGFILRARPKDQSFSPEFCGYCFSSEVVRNQIRSTSSYTTRALTNGRFLSDVKVPLPDDVAEQNAIAKSLSDVDGLIAVLEKLITKKRNLKTATMQQLLTGKKRLPGFFNQFTKISMGEDAKLNARIGWQALTTKEYLEIGTFRLVTGTDFENGRINWSSCHFVDEWRYSQDRNIQLRVGDVLLTKDGTIGKVGYVDRLDLPAALNSGVFVIRPINGKFVPLYLFYVLSSRIFEEFLSKITAGSTITHLYQKDFITFEFEAPEPDEQSEIAKVLKSIDQETDALEIRLIKTKAIKQGMMQELLTGRTRLV